MLQYSRGIQKRSQPETTRTNSKDDDGSAGIDLLFILSKRGIYNERISARRNNTFTHGNYAE